MDSAHDRIEREKRQAESRVRERLSEGGFCVALSGGGHRATLATLGALMALVDRRLNRNVMQIASVSGGSITNAFVAQRCSFETLAPGELDDIAKELVGVVVRHGVLTKRWFAALLGLPVLAAVAVGVVLAMLVTSVPLAVVAAVAVLFGALMFVGLEIEWLLNRRYFRLRDSSSGRRATLASLGGGRVEHLFCMTDLVLGLPVYLSNQIGGLFYRRLTEEKTTEGYPRDFQTAEAAERTIAGAVRASAGFPGIPPRRYRISENPKIPASQDAPDVAFLADGGLWNNLATQAQREDRLLTSYFGLDADGILRPFGRSPEYMPLLVVNGSAPLKPSHPSVYGVPGLAMLAALVATTRILSANTVHPRVDAMKRSFKRRIWKGRRPDTLDPLVLVVDLEDVAATEATYGAVTYGEEQIRSSDPAVKAWERNLLTRARVAAKHHATSPDIDWLEYLFQVPRPSGSHAVAGFADLAQWRMLTSSVAWQRAVEDHGPGALAVPTTLGRIDSRTARRLIARGYLNTYLVSMYLDPLNKGDLAYLERLPERLNDIVGSAR